MKKKLWIIIPIILIILAISIFVVTKFVFKTDNSKAENNQTEKEEYVEQIDTELFVAKFNTEVMDSSMEYPASTDYLTEEDGVYWYGLFDDIAFFVEPVQYTGDQQKDIVKNTGITFNKDGKNRDMALKYVFNLIKAHNNNLSKKQIDEIIKGAEELGKDNVNTKNGTGYQDFGLLVAFWEYDDQYQYTVERIMK